MHGFIFGAAIAYELGLGLGFIPIRKKGIKIGVIGGGGFLNPEFFKNPKVDLEDDQKNVCLLQRPL